MNETNNLLENEIIIDSASMGHLKETAMWSKILAITGFVFSVLVFAGGIITAVVFSRMSNTYNNFNSAAAESSGVLIGIVYAVMAVIIFICALFLLRFANKMKAALINTDQETFQQALLNQKFYYRITGVVTLLGALFMFFAMVVALFGYMSTR